MAQTDPFRYGYVRLILPSLFFKILIMYVKGLDSVIMVIGG